LSASHLVLGEYERSGREPGVSIFGWLGANPATALHNANVRSELRAPVGGVVGVLPLLADFRLTQCNITAPDYGRRTG
jgi:hypothetical protein